MENRRPISYTFEDIKRYKQGLMNREEMHAFEKASMEDPFLADALEGYMEADIALADQHLSNIKERIDHKEAQKEKAVVVSMPQKRFGLMRVAAMVIVIAGVGLLTYKIFDKESAVPKDELAQVDKPATELNPTTGQQSGATFKPDSMNESTTGWTKNGKDTSTYYGNTTTGLTDEGAFAAAKVKPVEEDKLSNNVTSKNDGDIARVAEKEMKDANGKPAKPALPIIDNPVREEVANTNIYRYKTEKNQVQNNQITGRVVSTNNQPLANANIRLDNSRKTVTTDNAGNFRLNSADTLVVATVETQGFLDTRVELRSNTNNTINLGSITLQPDPAFNDIAVTGLGSSKKKNRVADTLSSKPEGGWESFQQHVANKLNITIDTTGRDMRVTGGELEIEFFVDANGNPKDFKVLNSTNPDLNQQAIDAVKQGPKWATRKKKARILIRY